MVRVIDVVIGIIVFAIASGIIFMAWVDLGNNYDRSVEDKYSEYYDVVNDSLASTLAISSNMSETAEEGDLSFFSGGGVGNTVVSAFKLPLKALGTTSKLITTTWQKTGLPGELGWVFAAIASLITLIIIWTLLSAFFGRTF